MGASDDGFTAVGPATLGSLAPDGGETIATVATPAQRYVLGPVIGRGGMGEVRSARDTLLGRDVAVKVLREATQTHEELRARFVREARVQGRLEHPAIVPVHDLGLDDAGQPFFVMKRLTGMTLADILASRAETWTRRALLDRLVAVCQAVEYAHQRGVVHRDLKPQNVMLGDLGEVYVLDWGIARVLDEPVAPPSTDARPRVGTQTGALLGTPGYMPPEQLEGARVDQRSDVYALGCILFEILTGVPALPHGAAAFAATLEAPAHSPRARKPEAEIAPELDALCVAATEPVATERLASARALAEGLQRFLDGDRDLARRRALADGFAASAVAELAGVDTDDARARAMKDAGRALALDPSHASAQGVIARLLFQPPSVVPAAVSLAIAEHRDVTGRLHFRTAALTYAVYLALLPLLLVVHVRYAWPVVGVFALVAINTAILLAVSRRRHPSQRWYVVVLVLHAMLLGLLGVLGSPLLVLPAMAAVSLSAFIINPTVARPRSAVIAIIAATIAPIALELADLLPRTFTLKGDTIAIALWSVELPAGSLLGLVVVAGVVQLMSTAVMLGRLRRAEEHAQAEIHLYKWHLEQLVPPKV